MRYNLKKVLVIMGLAALPILASCGKDNATPDSENQQNTTNEDQQSTLNIEYIYTQSFKFHRVGDTTLIPSTAFIDTVAEHGANARVGQIHINPERNLMWSTAQEAQMVSRAKKLRNMYISSNNKLSGENTTLELDSAAFSNPSIQNVFHDTLRINLVQRQ